MPITSSIVAQITLNGDGSVRVREEHTFHTGVVRQFRYNGIEGVDHDVLLSAHAAIAESRELQMELGNLQQHLIDGGTPDTFDRQHNTLSSFIKPACREFMHLTDPSRAMALAKWIRDSLSNAQIDGKVPVSVRQKIRARITNLELIEAGLIADASHIVEVPE